jgi:anhydro-N-acetylmuramic acid kinase
MITIGLMSGTSVDGVDAALCEFDQNGKMKIRGTTFKPYDAALRERIHNLCNNASPTDDEVSQVDKELVGCFVTAVSELLEKVGISPVEIDAIGSHGQTIRHCPDCDPPYSLQIGDAEALAQQTGIPTIGDLRTGDLLAGGQGAPLAPGFHNAMFRSSTADRVVLNIGGIANVTYLPADQTKPVTGFDTGPGNTLLDTWVRQSLNQPFDRDGQWARRGNVIPELLQLLRAEPYFQLPPPKSTGRELFSREWLQRRLRDFIDRKAEDVAATLVALTVTTIVDAIEQFAGDADEIFVCGGGAHNRLIIERLESGLAGRHVATTEELGIDPDWVEAAAFAWLARQTLLGLPGNLPEVTGASRPVVLGTLHAATG